VRILFLIPTLSHGGAERQLAHLASELGGKGHEIHVGFCQGGPNIERLHARGIVLHQFFSPRLGRPGRRDLRNYNPWLLFKIVRLVRALRPEVVQSCLPQMDIWGGLSCILTGSRWILREPSCSDAYGPSLRNALRCWIARGTAAVVSNSRGGERYWQKIHPGSRRLRISNGIPLEEIDRTVPSLPSERADDRVVISVGRLDEGKNHATLIGAAKEVISSFPNLRIYICGEGPDRQRLERLATLSGLENRLRLLGSVSNPWALMKCANVFVSASKFEGFPNAVMEAMACGCPLVVSDIPSHREFLDGESAVFVDPNAPGSVVRAIVTVLSQPAAARLRAENARRIVENYSVAAMTRAYEGLFESLITNQNFREIRGAID
jgi:glycosyltransferase involved in cell wall biosynthesis